MRSVVSAPVLAAILMVFMALSHLGLGPIWNAVFQIGLGVAAALVVDGSFSWIGFIAGTLSPLPFAWFGASHASWAMSATVLIWLLSRVWRCNSTSQMGRLGAVSVFAALLAGFVSTAFAQADLTTSMAASLFSGAAIALTTMIFRVDSPSAHALLVASKSLDSPLRERIQDAVEWKRQEELGLGDRKNGNADWKVLLRALDQRIALRAVKGAQAQAAQDHLESVILKQIEKLGASGEALKRNEVASQGTPEPITSPRETAADPTPAAPHD